MTARQKKFGDEYPIDCNATQAAIRAGYNEKTAYSQGQRLLKNVEVKEYIDGQLEKIHCEKVADTKEVMEYLTSVMRDDNQATGLRIRSAELIGKRNGLFKEHYDVSCAIPVVISGEDELED